MPQNPPFGGLLNMVTHRADASLGPKAPSVPRAQPDFDDFVEANQLRLVRLASMVCASHADAQDAVQNGLLRAWRARQTLRHPDRARAWVDRIVMREAIRLVRRRRWPVTRLVGLSERDDVAYLADQAGLLDIHRAFQSLSPEQRLALGLRVHIGMSVPDIAETLDIGLETAKSRLRSARARMRLALEDHGSGGTSNAE